MEGWPEAIVSVPCREAEGRCWFRDGFSLQQKGGDSAEEAKLTKFLWRNGFPWARAKSRSCRVNAERGVG